MNYRVIQLEEINLELFAHFVRRQEVSKCYRKIDGEWQIKDIAFVDDWSTENYEELVKCLRETVAKGGFVFGAFDNGQLKGFVAVQSNLFGKNKEYVDLSSIHVSQDMRGKGIGKQLFAAAKAWAKENGAKKLYISAHSSVESQGFYKAVGCVEAQEYSQKHVEEEPCDCQLECVL